MSTRARQRRHTHRSRMELVVVPGDEYLRSVDPESLQVLAYCKLAKIPVDIHPGFMSWKSSSWEFPVLKHKSKKVASAPDRIITYFKENGFNLDSSLEETDLAEMAAYSALLTDKLIPALLYSRWMDSKNYVEVTRHQYGQMLSFPLSSFYLSWRHQCIRRTIMTGAPQESTLEQQGAELLAKAEDCINSLSTRLGDKQYFYGESLSSLDALVFGCLEVILQCPLPATNSLHTTTHTHPNLLRLCTDLRAKLFPDLKCRSFTPVPPADRPTLLRDPKVWLSVAIAALFLAVQAGRVGILPIPSLPSLPLLHPHRELEVGAEGETRD